MAAAPELNYAVSHPVIVEDVEKIQRGGEIIAARGPESLEDLSAADREAVNMWLIRAQSFLALAFGPRRTA